MGEMQREKVGVMIAGQTAEELMFNWTREDLYDFAKELRIPSRSRMTKPQLAMAIEDNIRRV